MPELNEPFAGTKSPAQSLIVFAYPFRIFFLSVAAWALVIVPLWLLIITGAFELPLAVAPIKHFTSGKCIYLPRANRLSKLARANSRQVGRPWLH